MDDNDRKTPRGKGPGKPAGARGGHAGKGGKPAFGAKKPFAKRRDDATGAERPKRDFADRPKRDSGDKPKRDFKSGDRPFAKAPRPDGKPFVKRDGPRKPYAPRGDRGVPAEGETPRREYKPRAFAADGERPKRDFADRPKRDFGDKPKRDFKSGDRPFAKGPRPDSKPFVKRDGPRKPYAPHGDRAVQAEGETPRREYKPRAVAADGDSPRRDFTDRPKRDFADRPKRDFSDKPKRDFTAPSASAGGGFKPRPRPAEAAAEEAGERIAKRLARAGLASRRDAEELIAAGRVKVNGRALASPAFNVMPDDIIHLDGMEIPPIERTRLFLFHKPAGVVTTNRDPEGRKTVFDVLPADLPRLMTIGRLDINTEGLLLLTNDGGLSRVLELPATGWLRRYRVRVHGKVEEQALAGLREGIAVDGVFYGAIEATLDREQGSNAWLTIGLREGKNREVKNILGSLGLDVTRLIRISYGPFQLNDLPEGHVVEIKGRMLRDQLGERLIEESGANFDAEITKPFTNKPVRREPVREEEPARPKFTRDGERGRIGEGGLIKNRKRREGSRDEALGKLSTRPERPKFGSGDRPDRPKLERGERPARAAKFGASPERTATFADKPGPKPRAGKRPEREQRPIEPPGQRKANVWMAPGARPIGKGRAEAEAAKAAEAKARKPAVRKPRGDGPRDRPFGKVPPKGPKAR